MSYGGTPYFFVVSSTVNLFTVENCVAPKKMIFFDEKLSFLKEIDSRSNQSAKGSLPKIGCIKVDGPKRPQAGPKRPQAGPKRHNNTAQDSQERPKITKLLFEK